MTAPPPPAVTAKRARRTKVVAMAEAERLQAEYAATRRAWAEAVGRPYLKDTDPRPPPGELDAEPDE